jgi:hypothetical protein
MIRVGMFAKHGLTCYNFPSFINARLRLSDCGLVIQNLFTPARLSFMLVLVSGISHQQRTPGRVMDSNDGILLFYRHDDDCLISCKSCYRARANSLILPQEFRMFIVKMYTCLTQGCLKLSSLPLRLINHTIFWL